MSPYTLRSISEAKHQGTGALPPGFLQRLWLYFEPCLMAARPYATTSRVGLNDPVATTSFQFSHGLSCNVVLLRPL